MEETPSPHVVLEEIQESQRIQMILPCFIWKCKTKSAIILCKNLGVIPTVNVKRSKIWLLWHHSAPAQGMGAQSGCRAGRMDRVPLVRAVTQGQGSRNQGTCGHFPSKLLLREVPKLLESKTDFLRAHIPKG